MTEYLIYLAKVSGSELAIYQVDVIVEDDLVDIVKPDDRVKCAGIYRALMHSGLTLSGGFRTSVFANSLTKRSSVDVSVGLTPSDIENINIIVSLR